MGFKIFKNNVFYSILTISIISVISKIFGFLRESFIASFFGTNLDIDIFYLTYGVLFPVSTVIGISIGISYVPIYTKNVIEFGERKAVLDSSNVLNYGLLIGLSLSAIVFFTADLFSYMLSSNHDLIFHNKLCWFIKLNSIGVTFQIGTYILIYILNSQKKFGIGEAMGFIYSIVVILGLISFSQKIGVDFLAFCFPISAIISFIILFIKVYKLKLYSVDFKEIGSGFRYFRLMMPVLLGTSTVYLGQIIDRLIAIGLKEGSVSALSYSGNVHSLINVLFVTSLINVYYTEFANSINDTNKLVKKWIDAISFLSFILIPISVLLYILSDDLISIIFERGEFDKNSVLLSSSAFKFYVLGTLFFAIRELTSRVFYSLGRSNVTMINGCFFLFFNVIISYVLSHNYGIMGITIGASITAFLSCFFLVNVLRKALDMNIYPTIKKILFLIVICLFLGFVFYIIHQFLFYERLLYKILNVIVTSLLFIAIYVIVLFSFKIDEVIILKNKIFGFFDKHK